MLRFIKILLFFFFVSAVNAQIKDSMQVKIALDTMSLVQRLDSSFIKTKDYPRSGEPLDSLQASRDEPPLMLQIERSMLDSLLRPYYNILIDTASEGEFSSKILITPKYRMTVDPNTSDTSYVPIPKSIDYFSTMKTYGIDTLGFSKADELVSINRSKRASDQCWWKHKNRIGFELNDVTFVNWHAGGSMAV